MPETRPSQAFREVGPDWGEVPHAAARTHTATCTLLHTAARTLQHARSVAECCTLLLHTATCTLLHTAAHCCTQLLHARSVAECCTLLLYTAAAHCYMHAATLLSECC